MNFRENLLCIVPPYGTRVPAGIAYLLGFLKSQSCYDFDFLDLRLGAPFDYTPTYRSTGAFGESYVIDVPDLPLVLQLIDSFENNTSLVKNRSDVIDCYCLERGISPQYLQKYLECMYRYIAQSFDHIPHIKFIGFSTWSTNYLFTLMAAAYLKQRKNPPTIIAGGPQVTSSKASAALALKSGLIDLVAEGDGEQTLFEIYNHYSIHKTLPTNVSGTSFYNGFTGKVESNARKVPKMNAIACPSFDEMPIHSYQSEVGVRALPLQFSRGCTDKCSFCSEWVFWNRFRPDDPENTVDHIVKLKKQYDCNFIDFSDSLLNGVPKRLNFLAEQLISKKVDIGWTSFMRAQIDPDTAKLIARSGCSGVFIGIESFSDDALELMNKRRTEADNVKAIRTFLDAGIQVTAGFIPGFPGDTRRGFLHSVAVTRQLQDEYKGQLELHEEPFTVMANAPIYKKLNDFGLEPVYWNDEVLDIASNYKDITAQVISQVKGDGQGLERLGRMAIIGSIKSDALAAGSFEDGEDDDLPFQYFSYDHLTEGWFCARTKTLNGDRYALLINENEKEILENFESEHYPLGELTTVKASRVFAPLEREHLLAPSRKRRSPVRGYYWKHSLDIAYVTPSEFVIARNMGSRHRHKTLVLNTLNLHIQKLNRPESEMLKLASGKKISTRQLLKVYQMKHPKISSRSSEKILKKLIENGILLECLKNKKIKSIATPKEEKQLQATTV